MKTLNIIQEARHRSRAIDAGIAQISQNYPELLKDPIIAEMVRSSALHSHVADRHQSAQSILETVPVCLHLAS